jgi:AraC-like DNA-binding protein
LLLVEAVRSYSLTLGEQERGWLKGFADPHIGRALALIHRNISNPWSVEALAREVGLSRSAFVDRFASLVGMPPIRYLTLWRLQTAKLNLSETQTTIARLHTRSAESEEAFSGPSTRIRTVTRAMAGSAGIGLSIAGARPGGSPGLFHRVRGLLAVLLQLPLLPRRAPSAAGMPIATSAIRLYSMAVAPRNPAPNCAGTNSDDGVCVLMLDLLPAPALARPVKAGRALP